MRRIAGLTVLLFAAAALGAFQWPVEEKVLITTFGERRWGYFHPGIDLAGGRQDVYPADSGELVYYEEEGSGLGVLPSGLGSFAVVEHERGLRTFYGHLEPGSINKDKMVLNPNDRFARVGGSGMAVGPRLHFQVIDREFDQFVNPLLILPPLRDTAKPVLEAIYLLENRERTELKDGATVSSGTYDLLLTVYDPSEYVRYFRPMTPYRVQVFLNGEQVAHVIFKALQPTDGRFILIETENASEDTFFYDDTTIRFGPLQFSPGDVILEILAEDISRNSITEEMRIRVVD